MKLNARKIVATAIFVVFGIAALILTIRTTAVDKRAITASIATMDVDAQTLSLSLVANKNLELKTISGTFPLAETSDSEDKFFTLAEVIPGKKLEDYGATIVSSDETTGGFAANMNAEAIPLELEDIIFTAVYNLREATEETFDFAATLTTATFVSDPDMTNESFKFDIDLGQNKQKIKYQKTEITKTVGDENFINPLTVMMIDLMDGQIVYESSNEEVATVDAAGEVTILKAGETTIKATAIATEAYAEASDSYVLTVEAPVDPTPPEPEPEPTPEPQPEPEPIPDPEPEPVHPKQKKEKDMSKAQMVEEKKPRQVVVDDADDRTLTTDNNSRALMAGLAAAAATVAIASLVFLIREILKDKN